MFGLHERSQTYQASSHRTYKSSHTVGTTTDNQLTTTLSPAYNGQLPETMVV